MKLTTKDIVAEFKKYPFHSQAGLGGAAHVICRFRMPSETWVFYVLEAEPLKRDIYDEMATGVKAGDTYGLRGIVFNRQHPFGQYTLFVLADLEQTKVFTEIRNPATGEDEYIEERAERCKDFVPCRVDEVVEHMDLLTADEFATDLLAPTGSVGKIEAAARQLDSEAQAGE